MEALPSRLRADFERCLRHKGIPPNTQAAYHTWLRYYWDFCHKYHFPHDQQASLPHFLKKLQDKKQTTAQQEQAAHAISLYYELLDVKAFIPTPDPSACALHADRSQEEKPTPDPSQEGNVAKGKARDESAQRVGSTTNEASISETVRLLGKVPSKDKEHPLGPPQGGNSGAREEASAEPPERIDSASLKAKSGRGASWKAEYTALAKTIEKRGYEPSIARRHTRWVRKFQAFTHSKAPDALTSDDVREFLQFLAEHDQNAAAKQNQAYDALLVFFRHVLEKEVEVERPGRAKAVATNGGRAKVTNDVEGLKPSRQRTGKGVSWATEYAELKNVIQVMHYSPKTLQRYTEWVRRFQAFTRSKDPKSLTTEDVKAFLTSLAVERKVAASTQNQAFNALLFFFRHVLKQEFGKVEGVVRAKRKRYVPVVLSREEIDAIVQHLEPPYNLVVKLLYGCGLRLSECVNLRVNCLNFDAGVLTVHDGKGQKDRTVPLPETIVPELRVQLETVKTLHQHDLDWDYAGVFLVHALERKYKNAARELIWQWFFPAPTLTYLEKTGEYRRYHLHRTLVQKAIKRAVDKAQICKRASAHTFRPFDKLRTGSVLPVTCFRRIMISGQFRSYWGIAI
jgi:integron integrase